LVIGKELNKLANHGAGFGGGENAGQVTAAQVEEMTKAEYSGYQMMGGKIDHVGPFLTPALSAIAIGLAHNPAAAQTNTLLGQISASQAKDKSVTAQATTFAGMLAQLSGIKTQDGTSSAAYQQALKGVQQTADKWYPEFSKDKTSAQMTATIDKQYAQAVTTAATLQGVVKDQSLKAAESHLTTLQNQLLSEQKSGATPAALKATQGLINQELGHIATIKSLTAKLHTETAAINNEKALEALIGPKLDAQAKAVNAGVIKVLPAITLSVSW
jgi:hypothetical protein